MENIKDLFNQYLNEQGSQSIDSIIKLEEEKKARTVLKAKRLVESQQKETSRSIPQTRGGMADRY
jgi:hypothetical protein